MSDNNDEAPTKSLSVPPQPKTDVPAGHCQECGGCGQVLLLTSSRACQRCGGAGRLRPAGGEAGWAVEAPDGSIRTYDRLGRLIVLTRPGHGEMGVWLSVGGTPGHATPCDRKVAAASSRAQSISGRMPLPRCDIGCVWGPIDGIRDHATPENNRAVESRDGDQVAPEPGAAGFCAECSGTEEPPPYPPPEYRERERIHDS